MQAVIKDIIIKGIVEALPCLLLSTLAGILLLRFVVASHRRRIIRRVQQRIDSATLTASGEYVVAQEGKDGKRQAAVNWKTMQASAWIQCEPNTSREFITIQSD